MADKPEYHTESLFCVPISSSGTANILVPTRHTKAFKEAYPDALAYGWVHVAADPVAAVAHFIEGQKPKEKSDD